MHTRKNTTPSPRHWIFGAIAFAAMGIAVGLKAAGRLRQAAWERMTPCLNKEDQEAITRLEGEGGPPAHG